MEVSLRPVTVNDWTFILDIRNEPEVRIACHDTTIIAYEAHRHYMERLQKDPNVYQWIISCDNEDVGHVKIIVGELGYMLKKGFRGKGLGTKFHELVFAEARKLGLTTLKDTIKVDNKASLKLALKTGFEERELIFKKGKPYAYLLEKHL